MVSGALLEADLPGKLAQLRPAERAALSEYLTRLQTRFDGHIFHAVLFGSRARGEGDAESDLDVLVVVDNDDWRFHDQIADESVEPWLRYRALISPVVMSIQEYEQLEQWQTLFYRNLQQDGIELWIARPALN